MGLVVRQRKQIISRVVEFFTYRHFPVFESFFSSISLIIAVVFVDPNRRHLKTSLLQSIVKTRRRRFFV